MAVPRAEEPNCRAVRACGLLDARRGRGRDRVRDRVRHRVRDRLRVKVRDTNPNPNPIPNPHLLARYLGVHEGCRPGRCVRGLQPAEQRRA